MVEKREIIGIDKDDVLVDLSRSLHPFHNRHYGTDITFEALQTFNLWETWRCTPEQAVERVFRFYDSEEFHTLTPVEGAVEAISKLKKKYGLVVISSRPAFMLEKTHLSIQRYFPECFDEIHLTDSYGPVGQYKKKSQVCKELGVKTLIDDSIENARDCATNGIGALLFRRPWNRGFSNSQLEQEGITPVESWQGALSLLL